MKGKKIKKCVAGALVMILLLSACFGLSAFASDGVTELAGTYYQATLSSGKYKITDDITFQGGIIIPSGATVYIDIPAGVTLTSNGQDAFFYRYPYFTRGCGRGSTPGIEVQTGAVLHITGDGNLVVKGGDGLAGGDGHNADEHSLQTSVDASGFASTDQWKGVYDYIYLSGGIAAPGGNGAFAPSPAIGGKGGAGAYDVNPKNWANIGVVIKSIKKTHDNKGTPATADGDDGSSGESMGTVYIEGSVNVTATAGGGDYATPGNGGKWLDSRRYAEDSYRSTHFPEVDYKSFYGFLSIGAPGGGGSAANASASIGGGGGGGGAGGYGLSGSWFTSHPDNILYSYDTTSSSGEDGNQDTGGSGGMSYRIKTDGWQSWKPGVGGSKGANGTGGTLYISETASVNGTSGDKLTQGALGATTNAAMGQGAEVKLLTRIEVTVKLDDGAYQDRDVTINSDGAEPAELTEGADGLYFAYVPTETKEYEIYVDGVATGYKFTPGTTETVNKVLNYYTCEVDVTLDGGDYGVKGDHIVQLMRGACIFNTLTETDTVGKYTSIILCDVSGNDTYDIFIDGSSYGKSLTVSNGVVVSLPYFTITAQTKLLEDNNESPYGGQNLALYKGDQYITRMIESPSGTHKAVVAGENENGILSYTLRVGDDYCADSIEASLGAIKVVNFYNTSVTLKDGTTNWSGQNVTLLGSGRVLNMSEEANSGVYKRVLFEEDATDYTVTVAGVPSTGKIQATVESKRTATVNFFTAAVNLTKDGNPWTEGASVMLKKNGVTAYILEKSGNSFVGSGIADGEYDVYVYGTNSDEDTGKTIETSSSAVSIDYFTVTYHKNISGTTGDQIRTYQSGITPDIASAPYEPGYTFISWKTGTSDSSEDYSPIAISSKTDVYAAWISPNIVLNNFVRCDEAGNVSAGGIYLTFPNLSIQGFPLDKDVIETVSITLENVKLVKNTLPAGWNDIGTWDDVTGNGTLVFQSSSPLSVRDVQIYLRSMVFTSNATSGDCSVQMSVFGSTN